MIVYWIIRKYNLFKRASQITNKRDFYPTFTVLGGGEGLEPGYQRETSWAELGITMVRTLSQQIHINVDFGLRISIFFFIKELAQNDPNCLMNTFKADS